MCMKIWWAKVVSQNLRAGLNKRSFAEQGAGTKLRPNGSALYEAGLVYYTHYGRHFQIWSKIITGNLIAYGSFSGVVFSEGLSESKQDVWYHWLETLKDI